jgi:hypothetical protein
MEVSEGASAESVSINWSYGRRMVYCTRRGGALPLP